MKKLIFLVLIATTATSLFAQWNVQHDGESINWSHDVGARDYNDFVYNIASIVGVAHWDVSEDGEINMVDRYQIQFSMVQTNRTIYCVTIFLVEDGHYYMKIARMSREDWTTMMSTWMRRVN